MADRTSDGLTDILSSGDEPNCGPAYRLDGPQTFSSSETSYFVPPLPGPEPIGPALSRAIESEIIPRLLMAHRTAEAVSSPVAETTFSSDEIEALVAITVSEPLKRARAFVDSLHARGITIEAIISDVLPAAARHVGWLWETDACTFVDVTFSLSRLQQLLRHYATNLTLAPSSPNETGRILLSAMPGEQHTFGVSVVEEFMRSAAWDVVPTAPTSDAQLVQQVSTEWFDIIGLSASGDGALAMMPRLVTAVRAASRNRSVRIIVGGAAVVRDTMAAGASGADAVAIDAANGLRQMEAMIRSVRQPC